MKAGGILLSTVAAAAAVNPCDVSVELLTMRLTTAIRHIWPNSKDVPILREIQTSMEELQSSNSSSNGLTPSSGLKQAPGTHVVLVCTCQQKNTYTKYLKYCKEGKGSDLPR